MNVREAARAYAEDCERSRDPGAEAPGRDGRAAEARPAREEALDGSAGGFVQEVAEHRRVGLAAVVAPRPLVQVALKPLYETE